MTLSLRCPAKVNLHLEVVGKRPDGYHELRTLFAAVGVWDELVLDETDGPLELEIEPRGAVDAGADNLVLRAARLLAGRSPGHAGARMLLRKHIPVGGGLGGGSSPAATALIGLCRLWRVELAERELADLAARLGADVPFFLSGGLAWGVGRGDAIRPLPDLAGYWAVILPGRAPVPTAEVFRRWRPEGLDAARGAEVYRWVEAGGPPPLHAFRNDLEPTVVAGWPEVAERLAAVRATAPLLGAVSGSGGSVYGLFDSRARASLAAAALRAWPALVAPLLGREQSRPRPQAGGESWRSPRSAST